MEVTMMSMVLKAILAPMGTVGKIPFNLKVSWDPGMTRNKRIKCPPYTCPPVSPIHFLLPYK